MKSAKRIREDFIKRFFRKMPINELQEILLSLWSLSPFAQKLHKGGITMRYSAKLMVALLGISLLFFGGAQAFGQEWSAQQKEVLQMEIKYWDSLKERNLKAYMELWHKDFIGWPHWSPKPAGKDGIEKQVISWYTLVDSYNLKPEAINLIDKFAIIYYRFSWTGPMGTWSGRIGHFWMKQDGKWQIIGGYSGGANTQE